MPYAFLVIGLILIRAGYKGQAGQLQTLVIKDFTGQGSFLYWIAAVAVIGGAGYVPALEKPSRALLLLLLLVLFLANGGASGSGGFFAKFTAAINNFQADPNQGSEATQGAPVADTGVPQTGGAGTSAALPPTASSGPSQANPNILPGQNNSPANDWLNRNIGTILPGFTNDMFNIFN
jgi:hypothetical protein